MARLGRELQTQCFHPITVLIHLSRVIFEYIIIVRPRESSHRDSEERNA